MTNIRTLLADNLKAYRRQRGWSQEMLAEKANLSLKFISTIEICRQFPSPEKLEQLAAALGVDTPELFSTGPVRMLPGTAVSLENLKSQLKDAVCAAIDSKVDGLDGE
jgi:transcriptional regulator with XRE-family HTH domain